MLNQGIIDYIKECREKGLPDELIKNELLKIGWRVEEIKEALGSFLPSEKKPDESPQIIQPKKSGLTTVILIIFVMVALGGGAYWYFVFNKSTAIDTAEQEGDNKAVVTSFDECVATSNLVMESYPRQCRYGDAIFIENIRNELEKTDLIRIDSPRPNQTITSPLTISGEARGTWFFEASFPVVLTDHDGNVIAQGIATAKDDWMTTDFVPFEATLTFTEDKNAYTKTGMLILYKDNPSGLPEYDDELKVPVGFIEDTGSTLLPSTKACTQEAKACPDGSYVGRTGPNCEFATCPEVYPQSTAECTKDSDCSSSQYICQAIQGVGTACPSTDPSCVSTYTIVKGECKLKEGNLCNVNSDCAVGNLCNKNICISPIGKQCSGTGDTICPVDFECVQGCGPPVFRYPDDTPPSYFCQLKGYSQPCPICLSGATLIDTPSGPVAVKDIRVGAPVWTVNKDENHTVGIVAKTSKVSVPPTHKMVHLILDDGRALFVSPGHPTVDGRTVGDIVVGDMYDGARIASSELVSYGDGYTYDILPSGETGFYFANGILLDSTINHRRAQ